MSGFSRGIPLPGPPGDHLRRQRGRRGRRGRALTVGPPDRGRVLPAWSRTPPPCHPAGRAPGGPRGGRRGGARPGRPTTPTPVTPTSRPPSRRRGTWTGGRVRRVARTGVLPHSTVGEMRDSATLELTGAQVELVEAVAATGILTVVVAMSGRLHVLGLMRPPRRAPCCGRLRRDGARAAWPTSAPARYLPQDGSQSRCRAPWASSRSTMTSEAGATARKSGATTPTRRWPLRLRPRPQRHDVRLRGARGGGRLHHRADDGVPRGDQRRGAYRVRGGPALRARPGGIGSPSDPRAGRLRPGGPRPRRLGSRSSPSTRAGSPSTTPPSPV